MVLTANVRCIEKICGIENVTSALFIMAIFTAIVQALCSFVFGNVIEEIGYQPFFLIVGIAGIVLFLVGIIIILGLPIMSFWTVAILSGIGLLIKGLSKITLAFANQNNY